MIGYQLEAAAARWLLNALVRDLTVQVRRNGAAVPPFAQEVCAWLSDVADVPAPEMSDSGPPVAIVSPMQPGLVPVAEAATLAGCSTRHARRLATSGRIRHQRIGRRLLLIDAAALVATLAGGPR